MNRRIAPFGGVALLVLIWIISEAWGGGWRRNSWHQGDEARRKQVLAELTTRPDVLINLDPIDMPSTADMIRLGRSATPAIINGLVNSMNPTVREACAAVLTGTRDPAALDALMDALDDPEHSVRVTAIKALGKVESRKATARLLAFIDKPNLSYGLRESAIKALGRLGDPSAVKPLLNYFKKTWDHAAQQALWDLRRHLNPRQITQLVVAPLKAYNADPQPPGWVLGTSIELAAKLKIRDAVKPLIKRFPDQTGLQNRIVRALGLIGDRKAERFLTGLLDATASARLINNVTFALQRLGVDVAPFLRKALTDRRAYIRFNAAFVVGDLKASALVPDLISALSDPNDFVRTEAAVALGKIADPKARQALEGASKEKNPIVRRDALLALAKIDYPAYRQRVFDELVSSNIRSVRNRAITQLCGGADPTALPVILEAVGPDDYEGRTQVLRCLGRFHTLDELGPASGAAVAFLLRLAAGSGDRHRALVLLARWADDRTRFILRQWLSAPGGEVDQLIRAMGRLKDAQSKGKVMPWFESTERASVRLYAAFYLAALGDAKGVDALVKALEIAPVELKRVAAQRMTELDVANIDGLQSRLTDLLTHADVYVRLYVARVLLQTGSTRATAALSKELDKRVPFIRDEVLDIVERAPKKVRAEVITGWLEDVDVHLRRDLRRILEKYAEG
ncbi:MAG: HEAT repeat domain-containing protein [Bradymonadia bacterium]